MAEDNAPCLQSGAHIDFLGDKFSDSAQSLMAKAIYDDKFFRKFGAKIKELRMERGLTQEEVTTFSTRYFQRLEAGKPIHLRTVLKLCNTFGVTLEKLFKDL